MCRPGDPRSRRIVLLRPILSRDECLQFRLTKLPQTIQIRYLCLDRVVRAVKPESPSRTAVNAEWPSNRIAKPARFDQVVFGKYFDAFSQARPLHWHPQSQCNIVNVDTTFFCQERRRKKDPQMAASSAHFERRLNSVLAQPVLEFQQVFHCVLVISIDGDPLAALIVGIDRVQADRNLSLQVSPDNVLGQLQRRAGPFVAQPEVVMTPRFRMRSSRLQRVGSAVDKQAPVILDDLRPYR